MKRIVIYFCILCVTIIPNAWAGEIFHSWKTGKPLRLAGYGGALMEYFVPPEVPIYINRYMRIDTNPTVEPTELALLDLNAPEINNLAEDVIFAIGLWENAPSSRLNLTFGGVIAIESLQAADGYNVITLTMQNSDMGFYVAEQANGDLIITEFDIYIFQLDNQYSMESKEAIDAGMLNPHWLYPSAAIAVITHEIGHGLGFDHSWLEAASVSNLTDVLSPASVMSYGFSDKSVDDKALALVDVTMVSRAYPKSTNRLSRTSCSIRGRVIDAQGAEDLFGANVLLLDNEGKAILQRISGYSSSIPGRNSYNGFFELDGVPPGTYDVLVASYDDPDVIRDTIIFPAYMVNGPLGMAMPVDTRPLLDFDFPKAFVRDVHVSAGEIVDLGYVVASEDRQFDGPSLVDARVCYDGPDDYSYYWFDFWSLSPFEMAHRSGIQSFYYYSTRLRGGSYYVKIYGWNGSGWISLQNWALTDFRGKKTTMTWDRLTYFEVEAEALEYDFFLIRTDLPRVEPGLVYGAKPFACNLHGDHYTTYLPPGSYALTVRGRPGTDTNFKILKVDFFDIN